MKIFKHKLSALFIAIVIAAGCGSSIHLARKNIKSLAPVPVIEKTYVPPVPAMIVMPIQQKERIRDNHFKAFKDSLVNVLINTKDGVSLINRKLDSMIQRENKMLLNQYKGNGILLSVRDSLKKLKLDTTRLYNKNKISAKTKNDAVIGDTFQTYGWYVICGLAAVLAAIFIAIGILAWYQKRTYKLLTKKSNDKK